MISIHHKYVEVNGIRMHYATAGMSDPLVVLLHGFPQFWYCWRHQINALSSRFTVVAPDLRGYNETERPDFFWDYRTDILVKDVLALIQTMGFEQVVLVGHDWGGLLAWYVGIHYPAYIKRLIILNMPHPVLFADALHTNPAQMLRSSYVSFFQLPLVPEWLLRMNNYEMIERAFRSRDKRSETFTDEDVQKYKEALRKPGALSAALNWYRAYVMLGGNLKTFFGNRQHVDVPTLLIWGEKDSFLGPELTQGTERYVRNLTRCSIPEASHWLQEEAPERVNHCIMDFLSDMAPTV
jgi:pimeloyl-ACP methyl ester carboxylesterase